MDAFKLKEEDNVRVTEGNLRETAVSIFERWVCHKMTVDLGQTSS